MLLRMMAKRNLDKQKRRITDPPFCILISELIKRFALSDFLASLRPVGEECFEALVGQRMLDECL
ncbi:hypothetical protein J2782_003846 [Brucella pseudogrignonensis]|uniref:Uncharacterized protein n=1 Tax=Brucella pseudogrignonensis TaxID=419475 RepID=A0ABU1MDH5_9HYPH|nr:hypothetical protein [Brucella pseudogrignonensis]